MLRTAIITRRNGTPAPETVARYLPSNYKVTTVTDDSVTIEGTDRYGWTLDDYVVPRLASGLITARETATPPVNVDELIAYEQGELDDDAVLRLFQRLVDTGLAWKLQGFYGRTAANLLTLGLITRPED